MNRTNRLKQNTRRFVFSNILAKDVLLELMEDRVLLASVYVTNTNDTGTGSFRQAIATAASLNGDDTIYFTGTAFSGSAVIKLNSELFIQDRTGKVTINGPGQSRLTLDGQNKTRVLNIQSETLLNNLTITSGNSENGYGGGGIYVRTNATLSSVSVVNCRATYGGALNCDATNNARLFVTIQNSIFSSNYGVYGGAVNNGSSNGGYCSVSFSGTSFINNSSSTRGGAIYNNGEYGTAILNVTGSSFTSNYAKDSGGAIMSNGYSGVAISTIKDSTYDRNSSYCGGAIASSGHYGDATLSITSSSFTNNTGVLGGAINQDGSNYGNGVASISDSYFASNKANCGAALYNDGRENGSGVTSISNSVFNYNKADAGTDTSGTGGAIFNEGSRGYTSIDVKSSQFTMNSAKDQGGAIISYGYLGYASMNIDDCGFYQNYSSRGGAVQNMGYNGYTITNIRNSIFKSNNGVDGGAVNNAGSSGHAVMRISKSSFTENSASNSGGAINSDGSYGNAELSIEDSTFTNNNSAIIGGALHTSGYGSGGKSVAVVSNSKFSNCTSADGGAISSDGRNAGNSSLSVMNSTFSYNYASNDGGGIKSDGGSGGSAILTVNDVSFNKNSSGRFGGQIHVSGYGPNGRQIANLSNLTLSNGTGSSGGAICADGRDSGYVELAVFNTTCSNNNAKTDGGAISLLGSSGTALLNVQNSTFYKNISNTYGGAISIYGNSGYTSGAISDSVFANNTSPSAGCIYNYGASYGTAFLNINSSSFSYNVATSGSGGAILNQGTNGYANTILNGTTFSYNRAQGSGGAISNYDGKSNLSVYKSTFFSNSATRGGAISSIKVQSDPYLLLSSVTVAYCNASFGGGIECNGSSSNIYNSVVSNNTAGNGSDIFGTVSNATYSLIGNTNSVSLLQSSNIYTGQTVFGPLGAYGGRTQTLPIIGNSIAINHGDPTTIGSLDQRGSTYTTADIGSFASQKTALVTSGNYQSTSTNNSFTNKLQLIVKDSFGNAIPNYPVYFSLPNNGPSGSFNTSNSVLTDSNGYATSPILTSNNLPGSFIVSAIAPGISPVYFNLTTLQSFASLITTTAGNSQQAVVTQNFPTRLSVKITDNYGKPFPNASVTFTAPENGASIIYSGSNTVTTDSNGIATSPVFSANSIAGSFSITASMTNGLKTNFTLSNLPSSPASIVKLSGDLQSTTVTDTFANALVVRVLDAFGNTIPNTSVVFNSPLFGPSLYLSKSFTVTTNSNGVASTSNSLYANTFSGDFRISVSTNNQIFENFNLSNLAGKAAKLKALSSSNINTIVGTPFDTSISLLVTDAYDNPIPNILVAFSSPSDGPGLDGVNLKKVYTSSSGIAELIRPVANKTSGNFVVEASIANAPRLTFNLTNRPGPIASLLSTGGSNQSTIVNSPFSYPLQLRVVDAYGNPVPNTLVIFSQPTTGPSITFQGSNAAYSDANGYVVSSTLMAVNSPGSFFVTANASGVNSAAFYLTNFATAPTLQSIVIQQGSTGRSFVRYLDININDPATVTSIVNSLNRSAPRITLTNTGLKGTTKKVVTIKGLAKAIGNTIRIDFGTKGVGGNAATNTADGSYLISLDVDGNGSLETSQRFFRLLGDVNGDKVVDSKDTALVTANLNKGGMNQPGDTNGDGKVNATDVSYVKRAQRRRITV